MNIIFLSLMYDRSKEEYYLSRSKAGLPVALNVLQNNVIKGLEMFNDTPVKVVSSLPVGNFPKLYKDLIIPEKLWKHRTSGDNNISIGYLNLPFLKDIQRQKRAYRQIERLVKNRNDKIILFLFDIHLPFLKAAVKIKGKYPNAKLVNMITDLPNEFGYDHGQKGIKKMLLDYRGKQQIKFISSADAYILLTEKMSHVIGRVQQPFLVVEGMIDPETIQMSSSMKTQNSRKAIMYAGYLKKEYGISILMEAFTKIDDKDIELWLFGGGDMIEEIKEASLKDSRIKYFGYRTKKEVEEYQSRASVLINPRMNDGTYTAYSFPSKTLEYLKTLKPTIGYLLNGMPKEYSNVLFIPMDNSVESLSLTIAKSLRLTQHELNEYGLIVSDFLLEKTIAKQSKRIFDLITEL